VLPQSVAEHYRAQQALIVATLALVRREWARMGPDFDVSWAALGRRILLLTTSAQLGAARSGAAYVPATLAELGTPVDPVAEVLPAAFAGVASDGRPLDSLLGESVIKAKVARGGGAPVDQALTVGGRALDMYVHTQVADAARGAASVAIVTRPTIGWVRLVNVPCCPRCAILAGKWFGWNDGFERHPQDLCRHIPAPESVSGDLGTTPAALFAGGHVRGLSEGEQRAIADGADPGQVVNARRGRQGMSTSEGTTKRGLYGGYVRNADGSLSRRDASEFRRTGGGRRRYQRTTQRRLTPDAIYDMAADREHALDLLRQYGYIR
jgi:hypothetical protein